MIIVISYIIEIILYLYYWNTFYKKLLNGFVWIKNYMFVKNSLIEKFATLLSVYLNLKCEKCVYDNI